MFNCNIHPPESSSQSSSTKASSSTSSPIHINKNHNFIKSNKSLNSNEKKLKRELKKKAKLYQRVHKLSKRIKHAQSRKDVKIENEARNELEALLQRLKEMIPEKYDENDDDPSLSQNEHLKNLEILIYEIHDPMNDNGNSNGNSNGVGNNENIASKNQNINKIQIDLNRAYEMNCKHLILSIYNQVISQEKQKDTTITATNSSDVNSKNRNFPHSPHKQKDHKQSYKRSNDRQEDLQMTRNLLQHMTKGTQSRDMFRNFNVLWGYTRQKFYTRAMLLVTSLLKVQYITVAPMDSTYDDVNHYESSHHDNCDVQTNNRSNSMNSHPVVHTMQTTDSMKHGAFQIITQPPSISSSLSKFNAIVPPLLFQKLKSVRSVCSFGCGPGNDMVGFLSLMSFIQNKNKINRETSVLKKVESVSKPMLNETTTTPTTNNNEHHPEIQQVCLFDYAMDDWKQILIPVLDCCQDNDQYSILQSSCHVVMDKCDITLPLFLYDETKPLLSSSSLSCSSNTPFDQHHVNAKAAQYSQTSDIFLISYLLSETRGLWEAFITQLFDLAKAGSMFYFAEPTPWQLHRLISLFEIKHNDNDEEHAIADGGNEIKLASCQRENGLNENKKDKKKTSSNENERHEKKKMIRFFWLDSSMNIPLLQGLQTRLGPAVLLGVKL